MLKKYWSRVLFLLLMFLCYGLAVVYNGKLKNDVKGTATAVIMSGGMDAKSATKIQEREKEQDNPLFFTIWGEKENAIAENKEYQKNSTVTAIYVSESTQLLFNSMTALSEDDLTGCLIDEKTALELFGSTNVAGQTLTFDEKTLTIRQVIKEERQVLVMQAAGSEVSLDTVTIQCTDDAAAQRTAEEFLARHGIDGKLMDMPLLTGISSIMVWLLPFCMAVGVMVTAIKYARVDSKTDKWGNLWWVFAFVVFIVIVYGILHFVSIPRDMIPTKWSDFTFWTELWKKKQEALLFLVQSAKRQPQIDTIMVFFKSVTYSVASIFLYFLSFRKKI